MRQKILSWVTKQAIKDPSLPIRLMYYAYLTTALISLVLLIVAPWAWLYGVGLLCFLLTFGLGFIAFTLLLETLKSVSRSTENINMEEVMALANSLFGNMPVKPTGPIGVVDDDRK